MGGSEHRQSVNCSRPLSCFLWNESPQRRRGHWGDQGAQASEAVVARALNTGNGAQIFVDGAEIAIAHMLVRRPGHDLKECSVERKRQTRVKGIRVHARPDGVAKLLERVAPDRQAALIRRQVARDDVHNAASHPSILSA